MSLKVIEDFVKEGHPNRPGIKLLGLKARVWHGTDNLNPGAGDTMHRQYMGRPYVARFNKAKNKNEFFEADGVKPFVFGGAHVYIDKDSAIITCPLDEVVWGCGDRRLPFDNGFKGQTRIAAEVFNNQNNSYTWNIELCMNDMEAWDQVLANALEFVKAHMSVNGMEDYRHYDLTGKLCPTPFINASIKEEDPRWVEFRNRIKKTLSSKS
jgi:N-acetylmuramoyl-L-alanine amidase